MKTASLEKKEPKSLELKKAELTDNNIQLDKPEKKASVQAKKEVYKRPDYLYRLL